MTDQVETKQVTWEDLEVAEEQKVCQGCFDPRCGCGEHGVTEWEEGNEPVPTELPRMGKMLVMTNVSLEQWKEAMENATRRLARMQKVYRYAGGGHFEDIGGIALCTPHRDPLTGHMEE